ncbi:hypothetical protein D9M71_642010 [compost metagenome]
MEWPKEQSTSITELPCEVASTLSSRALPACPRLWWKAPARPWLARISTASSMLAASRLARPSTCRGKPAGMACGRRLFTVTTRPLALTAKVWPGMEPG